LALEARAPCAGKAANTALAWIQVIQYFGTHIQTDRHYPFYALANFVTGLDLHIGDAYRLGCLFSPIVRHFRKSISICKKGIAASPGWLELPRDIGGVHSLDSMIASGPLCLWSRER
jgi:hypothetical protein